MKYLVTTNQAVIAKLLGISVKIRHHNRMKQKPTLIFNNRFFNELKADPILGNHCREVNEAFYSLVTPQNPPEPKWVSVSANCAESLGLSTEQITSKPFQNWLSGRSNMQESQSYAMCYGGHQFGHWAGQLGDGRAINIGEIVHQQQTTALQLKGAGLTPYSRNGDGLAVLRSSIREYICSEAMYHLGIATTRALSLMTSGEQVLRDMFYDGHPEMEPGAILCRTSPSFIRFGHFEIFAARGDLDNLKTLADFTLRHHFPHLLHHPADLDAKKYKMFFKEVCQSSLKLILDWMRVGFVHGVMNTDNMSILGLTIDFGPYGWLDHYDPNWTPNTTDFSHRRYSYQQQPMVAQWNLSRLANALFPLIKDADFLMKVLNEFAEDYQQGWLEMMRSKLGLVHDDAESDEDLVLQLMHLLEQVETDWTLFFRHLADIDGDISKTSSSGDDLNNMQDCFYHFDDLPQDYLQQFKDWLNKYKKRAGSQQLLDKDRRINMNRINPKYIFRNYLAQMAIEKAHDGDYSMIEELMETLQNPYDEQPERENFSQKRPEWARTKPGCSTLSCSS